MHRSLNFVFKSIPSEPPKNPVGGPGTVLWGPKTTPQKHNFDSDSSFAYTYSEEIIFTVLDELRGSKSFLIQLEAADGPMRFSNIYDSESKNY